MIYISLSDFYLPCSLLKQSTCLKSKYAVKIPQVRKGEPTTLSPQSSTVNVTRNALVSPGEPYSHPLGDSCHTCFLPSWGLTSGRPLISARGTSK